MAKYFYILISLLLTYLCGCAREGNPYMRINNDSFQLAYKSFEKADGPKVTLLGIVHIGDQEYYERIQKRLEKADAVLYELVGTKEENDEIKKNCPEVRAKKSERYYRDAAKMYGLVAQKDHLKPKANFIHADFSQSQLLDAFGVAKSNNLCERYKVKQELRLPTSSDEQILNKEQAELSRNAIALLFVKKLDFHRDAQISKKMKIILFERNDFVMNKLKTELPKYKKGQEIVILYGAGHMPDIERSINNMGFSMTKEKWLPLFKL